MQRVMGTRCRDMKPFKTTPRGDAEVAKKGVFWWRAALSYKMFKLNQATKAQVNIEGREECKYSH